jgi:hypothetical protein
MYVAGLDEVVVSVDPKRNRGMFHAFAILTEVLRHALQRDHQGSEV